MNIQDLLEHQEITIELLKKLKIAKKTGVNPVPDFMEFLEGAVIMPDHSWFMVFKKDPVMILVQENPLRFSIQISKTTSFTPIIYSDKTLVETFFNVKNNNMEQLQQQIGKLCKPWVKYAHNLETLAILKKVAKNADTRPT